MYENTYLYNIKQTQRDMKVQELKAGDVIFFDCKENPEFSRNFTISKITNKRVSWYATKEYKGGSGKNRMTMVWVSVKQFQIGLDRGSYSLVTK